MSDERWDGSGSRSRPNPVVLLVVPVVLALLIQVPGTVGISLWQRVPFGYAALSVTLAAASALALLGARRYPGPTVAVVTALTVADLFVPPDLSPPYVALAFAIIGAVARRARLWALISVGAAWLVAIVALGLLNPDGVHPFRVAITTLALAACFAIGEGIRRRMDRGTERRAQLQERRRTVEQEERTRIARELHDVLAHSLSQIAVQSGVGLHLFDREPERAREALANIRALSATGLDEVRGVLSFLRGDEASPITAPLTPQPQLADLGMLATQRTGLGLEVTIADHLGETLPPSSVQTAAFRIAQEALTNVVRHSGGSAATITLDRVHSADGDQLVLTVEDDGTGRGPAATDGAGIRGMRERAELAGGELTITAAPRAGTVVTARIPWEGVA
ncbi:sensor histidine kinase [Microbacterium sp. zg.B48]|uniref:sensor histidine kinase n=1 Tax=unclassified Microbacterium TaxID=2609290 RepID=UPI00214CEC1A|nr:MULTISPECIES: sensor histidine kinase [unclassified Microbacterium]MCR2763468.1 sensor histidine kinase [Microbacterium sp. zg.B48]MCR2809189.1 sensor histidine kinase [Microbacterium sp. zg.B185]WIM20338.1 sensor histidine kinase [Microbacterium sp. zg-B185]